MRKSEKRMVGVTPRRRSGHRTRCIKIGERQYSQVTYIAGREGITYSDALSGMMTSTIRADMSKSEAEFAGICARVAQAITAQDANAAASAAAEACLFWSDAPTEEILTIAETAAALAATVAAEWKRIKQ